MIFFKFQLVQPEDFADFINGIDPRYDTHVMMMRVNYEKEMFTKKDSDGNPDSSGKMFENKRTYFA